MIGACLDILQLDEPRSSYRACVENLLCLRPTYLLGAIMPLTELNSQQLDNAINQLDPILRRAQANGDEMNSGLKGAGNFHKTLKHDAAGYVVPTQFSNFVSALKAAQQGGNFETLDM